MQTTEPSGQGNPLGTQPIPRLLAKYAVPSMISMLVMSIYNIVDQVFISWDLGYVGNAATTVAFPLITIMLALCLLVGNGASALISLELGRGHAYLAKRILCNAFLLMMAICAVLMAVSLGFLEPLLVALGGDAAVLPHARDYTSIIMFGAPFAMISSGFANVIRADGSPRYSMAATLTGALLNVALDPLFIFTLQMGVKGAAYATVLSQILSACMVLYYLARRSKLARFSPSAFRPHPDLLRRICLLGSSSFVTQASITVVNIALNRTIAAYAADTVYGSPLALAAMGVVMKINAILTSVVLGVALGAQPILGYNYGARQYQRVRCALRMEILAATAFSTLACILFVTVPQVFISIFRDESPLFNEFACRYLSTYLSGIFIIGLQIPSSTYFQAVGKPVKSMFLSMTRHLLLLVPLVLILPRYYGLDGVLYAGPRADLTAAAITSCFILTEIRKLRKLEAPENGATS